MAHWVRSFSAKTALREGYHPFQCRMCGTDYAVFANMRHRHARNPLCFNCRTERDMRDEEDELLESLVDGPAADVDDPFTAGPSHSRRPEGAQPECAGCGLPAGWMELYGGDGEFSASFWDLCAVCLCCRECCLC